MIKVSMCIAAMEQYLMEILGENLVSFTYSVVTFPFDYSLSSYTDNHKLNFLVLGKTMNEILLKINGSFGALEKKFSINLSK